MSNVIDITKLIKEKHEKDWYKFVCDLSKNASTPKDRLHWTEIKIALEFEHHFNKTGEYHPEDPIGMDLDDTYL